MFSWRFSPYYRIMPHGMPPKTVTEKLMLACLLVGATLSATPSVKPRAGDALFLDKRLRQPVNIFAASMPAYDLPEVRIPASAGMRCEFPVASHRLSSFDCRYGVSSAGRDRPLARKARSYECPSPQTGSSLPR